MALAVVTVSTSCQHADNSAQTQNTSEAEQNASEADTEEQSGDEPGGFKVSKERQERITDQLKELTKDHPDRPDGLKGLDELMNPAGVEKDTADPASGTKLGDQG